MRIDLDAPDPAELRETAAEMPSFYFLGEELKPFSLGRQLAFERIVSGSGGKSLELAIAMVYLCTVEPGIYERTRTQEDKDVFADRMAKWAEAKGINCRNHAGKEVKRIADEIWAGLEASEFDIKLKPEQQSKDPESPNESGREAQ